MAWKIARITEYTTVAVVVVLAGSTAWSVWRSTPDDVTGSIVRAPAPATTTYKLPPIINAATSTPPAQNRALIAHIIEPRETMKSIAARFNTRVADIAITNRIDVDTKLRPGEILVVPVYR